VRPVEVERNVPRPQRRHLPAAPVRTLQRQALARRVHGERGMHARPSHGACLRVAVSAKAGDARGVLFATQAYSKSKRG